MPEIARRLSSIETRVDRWPFAVMAATIASLAVIKHGFTYVQMFEDRFLTETPDSLQFPGIIFTRSLLLTRLFNLETRLAYQAFSILTSLIVLGLIAWLLHRRLPKKAASVAFACICLGQVGLVILGQFGREDTWLILGGSLLILTSDRSLAAWIIGAMIMSLSNPAQALVALVLMFGLAHTHRFRQFRRRTAIALVVSSVWMMVVYIQAPGNQVDSFSAYWMTGVNGFLVTGPLRVYSIYGILWLGVLTLILASKRGPLIVSLCVLVAGPLLVLLLTGDGTRVGVGVSILMLLAMLVVGCEPLARWFSRRIGPFILVSAVLVLLISPTLNIYEFQLIMPWEWMKYQIGDAILSGLSSG